MHSKYHIDFYLTDDIIFRFGSSSVIKGPFENPIKRLYELKPNVYATIPYIIS